MAAVPPAKRRRISSSEIGLPSRSKLGSLAKQHDREFFRNADSWDLENTYEKRPRKNKKKEKESTRLPIKTLEGRLEQVETADNNFSEHDDQNDKPDETPGEDLQAESVSTEPEKPKLSARQEIVEAKEELARIAGLINEAPEENVGRLKRLAEIGRSDNITVKKLSLATQMTVYKDIIPGYRIRPWTNADTAGRITKEVKALRNFEQGLVSAYQSYVGDLSRHAQVAKGGNSVAKASLASTAISCATSLLLSVPHFNFRGDLVKIVVDKLSTRKLDGDFSKCVQTLETLFSDDEDGQPSLDSLITLTRMMKARNFNIHETILNTFLHLRLLSEFSFKASQSSIDKDNEGADIIPKKKRVFRTKKERKTAKELKQVQKEMHEADAVVGREERDRLQAEMLKLVFTTYFQILKAWSAPLMGAVLEGLAKYAHLINQDFFGDILEVLRELCGQAVSNNEDLDENNDGGDEEGRIKWDDPQRAVLLCTTTAFELLSGQDATKAASNLHLDLSYFTATLYQILPTLCLAPDIELSSKSLHLPDPRKISGEPAKVNARATATLLIRALVAALMPRPTPQARVAAFAHRMTNSALQTPERSATALIGSMNQIAKVHGKKIASLWDTEERRGDGNFDVWGSELELANPYAGTIWAGELLRLHYAPSVREGISNLESCITMAQGARK